MSSFFSYTYKRSYDVNIITTFNEFSEIDYLPIYIRINEAISKSFYVYSKMESDLISANFDFSYQTIYNSEYATLETRLNNFYPGFEVVDVDLATKLFDLYSFNSINLVEILKNNLDIKRTYRKIIRNGLKAIKAEMDTKIQNIKNSSYEEFGMKVDYCTFGQITNRAIKLIEELVEYKPNQILDWYLNYECKLNETSCTNVNVFRNQIDSNLDQYFKHTDSSSESIIPTNNLIKSNVEKNVPYNQTSFATLFEIELKKRNLTNVISKNFAVFALQYLALEIFRSKWKLIYSPAIKYISYNVLEFEAIISSWNYEDAKVAQKELISEFNKFVSNEDLFNKFKRNSKNEILNDIKSENYFSIKFIERITNSDINKYLEVLDKTQLNEIGLPSFKGTVFLKGKN